MIYGLSEANTAKVDWNYYFYLFKQKRYNKVELTIYGIMVMSIY